MALDQSALLEVLDALKVADVGDRVRAAAETVFQALIEAELTETIGAALHERSDSRTHQRNGHRTRTLSTTAGDLELRIPKLRTGSFFPSLLERRRRRVDQALFAVVGGDAGRQTGRVPRSYVPASGDHPGGLLKNVLEQGSLSMGHRAGPGSRQTRACSSPRAALSQPAP